MTTRSEEQVEKLDALAEGTTGEVLISRTDLARFLTIVAESLAMVEVRGGPDTVPDLAAKARSHRESFNKGCELLDVNPGDVIYEYVAMVAAHDALKRVQESVRVVSLEDLLFGLENR